MDDLISLTHPIYSIWAFASATTMNTQFPTYSDAARHCLDMPVVHAIVACWNCGYKVQPGRYCLKCGKKNWATVLSLHLAHSLFSQLKSVRWILLCVPVTFSISCFRFHFFSVYDGCHATVPIDSHTALIYPWVCSYQNGGAVRAICWEIESIDVWCSV